MFKNILIDLEFMQSVRRYHNEVSGYRRRFTRVINNAQMDGIEVLDPFEHEEVFTENNESMIWYYDEDLGSASILHNVPAMNIIKFFREIESGIHINDYSKLIKDVKIKGVDDNGN